MRHVRDGQYRSYGAYGAFAGNGGARSAYTGEVHEIDTNGYVLGKRHYSPALRRFLAPDAYSPFGSGGYNRYAYCGGDPINRVDPGGNHWKDVVRTLFGRGNRRSNGYVALRSDSATPTSLATAAASTQEAASPAVAIRSSASGSRAASPGATVMGAVSTQAASNAHSLETVWYLGAPAPGRREFGASQNGREVNIVADLNEWPPDRLTRNRLGEPDLKRTWSVLRHPDNPASFVIAADTEVHNKDLDSLYEGLEAHGVSESIIYTGFHGAPHGNNWDPRTGGPREPTQRSHMEDYAFARERWTTARKTVRVANAANLTKSTFRQALAENGVHVISTCFGLADEAVMEALRLTEVTVYDRRTP
ncbi:RHS repeat-associated core domain-containing protein [Luteibacter sp. Lutesp34]|uniref:RHS repeat-associated core domain-containing protein n=1 Tax=Luteibacter sp. Lutesp34 TaxID=3243030 RepID=UPI0039B657A4